MTRRLLPQTFRRDGRSFEYREEMGEFRFAPDHLRTARLDQLVREGLADSLAIVFDNLEPRRGGDERFLALSRLIKAGPVSPGLFGAYVELVLAVFDQRDADTECLVGELLHWRRNGASDFRIVTLDDTELGQGQAARYRRLTSADIPGEIRPLDAADYTRAAAQLTQALALLDAGAPDLLKEIRNLIREVVLVAPGSCPTAAAFNGASTFSLWGAVVLNAKCFGNRLDVAVSLVHEAAHSHLFGLTLGGRLTENEPTEVYASPLRQDLRPMEGVAHAVYVTARVIHLLELLIGSRHLRADETACAREQLRRYEQAYDQGLATVSAHASFTPPGAAAFSALRRHMESRRQTAYAR